MQKQTSNQELQDDDSLDQQIRLNEINKRLALDCAGYFLTESSERLRLNSDLPYSPVIIAAHAMIAHSEWKHIIDLQHSKIVPARLVEFKGALDELNESVKDINESIDYAVAKLSEEGEA